MDRCWVFLMAWVAGISRGGSVVKTGAEALGFSTGLPKSTPGSESREEVGEGVRRPGGKDWGTS